jgi:hypothetical protein
MLAKSGMFKRRPHAGMSGRHSPELPRRAKSSYSRICKSIGSAVFQPSSRDPNAHENMVFGGKQHPTRCGFSDKLYSKYDYIGPIIYSMSRLNSRSHASGGLGRLLKSSASANTGEPATFAASSSSYPLQSRQSRRVGMPEDEDQWGGGGFSMQRPKPVPARSTSLGPFGVQPSASASVQSTSSLPPILCQGCHTRDPRKLTRDDHAGEWVCDCGVVGAKCPFDPDYKETHDTDNSKARADRPQAEKRKERFGHVPVNAPDQAKRIKESMGLAPKVDVGSTVPDNVKSKLKLGFAAQNANKEAEAPVEGMEKKHVGKLTSVIKEINSLVVQMAPVEPEVGRVIRMKTDRIYRDSYKHSKFCDNPHCQKALVSKPARVIAHKSFVYTVEQLCKGVEQADGVSKTQLTSLHERVSDSQIFRLRDNATQHEAVLAMINSLDTGDICVPCPVVEEEDAEEEKAFKTPGGAKPGRGQPAAARAGGNQNMHRQDSGLQPSPVMVVREAVFKLSDQFKFAPSVRDAAVDALGDRDFASVIKNDTVVPHTASKFGKAYILLRSIREEAEATSGGGSSGAVADHSTHIQRVNMSNFNVDDLVAQMRKMLPKTGSQGSALSAHDVGGDDESFY